MIRSLGTLIGALISFILIILTTLVIACYSTLGTNTIIKLVEYFIPGTLSIQSIHGKLSDQFECQNIDYKNNGLQVQVGLLQISWMPELIFSKTLYIHSIKINDLNITPRQKESKPFHKPSWFPTRYIIKQFNITDAKWLGGNIPNVPINTQGSFTFHDKTFSLTHFTLDAGKNHISASLKFNQFLKGQWQANIPSLSTLIPNASGNIVSSGFITENTAVPMINAQLKISHLQYQSASIDTLNATLQGSALQHLLTLQIQNQKSALSLKTDGTIKDLKWYGIIRQLNLSNPIIGQWRLSKTAGINIQKSQINIVNLTLAGKSGSVTFNATINPKQKSASVRCQGNNILAINTNVYQVYVSPDLTLAAQKDRLTLNGNLLIPKAIISEPDFKSNSVELPNDVIFTDNQDRTTSLLSQLTANITLQLGDQIHVNIEGLSGQVKGKLQLQDAPNRPTTANGILSIHQGKYNAYHQELNIDNGELIFNQSAIENPGIQIRASKKVTSIGNNTNKTLTPNILPSVGLTQTAITNPILSQQSTITVGVDVNGTLQNPQLTLFSDQSGLSQSDILSYLLFNHPADQISLSDAKILLETSSSLPLSGNNIEALQREIQSLFSLDQLNIESTNYIDPTTSTLKQNTSLVLAKALSPRLYISYSLGLLSPVNVLTVKYLLSSKWSLQSTNSTFANGVDVFYTIEKN